MSTNTTTEAIDVVCVPRAIPLGERVAHFELGRRLFTEMVEERIDLPSGIALQLPGGIVGAFGIASRCLLPRLSRFRKRGS